ncbi:MAG: hypothetical protein WD512_08090 [Candidatus Paceibacterota bacterium]
MKTFKVITIILFLGFNLTTLCAQSQKNCDSHWIDSAVDAAEIDITGNYERDYPLGQRLILNDDGTFKENLLFEYDTGSPIKYRFGTYSIIKDTLHVKFKGYELNEDTNQSDLDTFLAEYPKPVFKLDYATNDINGSLFRKKDGYLFIVRPDLKQLFCISRGVSIINRQTGEVASPDFLLKIK